MQSVAVLMVLAVAAAGCASGKAGLGAFSLPQNVTAAAPEAALPAELRALAGAWTGTWLTPGWGPGYSALLVVEQIDSSEATVLYAWANPAAQDSGWYRQKAALAAGPGLVWTRGDWEFTFQLARDPGAMSGGVRSIRHGTDKAFVQMARVALEPPPAASPAPTLALPRLPAVPVLPAAQDLPAEFGALLGTWEGAWDSGVLSRLAIWEINSATAMLMYAWSDDPHGGFKADYARHIALVYGPERRITWGTSPRFTFRLSPDGKSLRGEWEKEGRVSAVVMKKVSEVVASD